MKTKNISKVSLCVLIAGLLAGFSISAYAAETYQLDPAHTSVMFRVKHLGVAYVYGRFNGPRGFFTFDESSPSQSAIEVQVNVKDVDTAVEKRDHHLKSPDFFDAEEYPIVTFKSTAIKKLSQEAYEVSGNITLLGKTRPITVKAVDTGSGKDPWGNFRRGFETSFSINRSDFGMNFMLDGVSDEVVITVSVEGIRQ
ncbi:MAG: YceI family protein [Desulfobacterales bacterium]|nr:MAG: YceI family protein [Desulfobacterales bacterium]